MGPCCLLSIGILKYIIYGLAAGFFVFGVLLLVEGFFTTGAIRDLYGEFKITACGRCLTAFVRTLGFLVDFLRENDEVDCASHGDSTMCLLQRHNGSLTDRDAIILMGCCAITQPKGSRNVNCEK